MIRALLLGLLCAGGLRADAVLALSGTASPVAALPDSVTAAGAQGVSSAAQDLSATAAQAQEGEEGIYYGQTVAADATGATLPAAAGGSYLSHARITAFAWGSPGQELKGAEVVLNGEYLGRSPLLLKGLLVDGGAPVKLSLHLEGYSEGQRPAVHLPEEGDLRVALLDDNAEGWISTPAWIAGLGLVAASVLAYRSETSQVGLGLAGGGIAVIAVSQLLVRWLGQPALRRAVQAFNNRPEPAPQP